MSSVRASAVLAAVVLALLASGDPAQAAPLNVPIQLQPSYSRVIERAPVDVLVPDTVNLDYDGPIYASGSTGRRSWSLALAGAPRCGGATACFLASFSGTRGAKRDYTRRVRLRGGVSGWFKPRSCGASCSPPAIQFTRRGVLYEIQANVSGRGSAAQRSALRSAANSALKAGARRLG